MKAVLLAGGLGTRLKPFTDTIPKPLLPLGEKSVLEVQIEALRSHGFDEIYLALGHKSEYVKSFFGDGSRYDVRLHFSVEEEPLGTCGPITLLKDELTEPFVLMNGDILSKADFADIYRFAQGYPDSFFTVVTKIITTPFRFGNILSNGPYILGVEEKPDLRFEIMAGIYVLKPQVFDYVPEGEYFGIDDLVREMLRAGLPITRYQLKEYWVDIGVVEDYEKARQIYEKHFKSPS